MLQGLLGCNPLERLILEESADQINHFFRGLIVKAGRDTQRFLLRQGRLRVVRINPKGLFLRGRSLGLDHESELMNVALPTKQCVRVILSVLSVAQLR